MRGWLLGLLPLVFLASGAFADDAGARGQREACAEELRSDAAEEAGWNAATFETTSDDDVAGAIPQRLAFIRRHMREVCTGVLTESDISDLESVVDKIGATLTKMVDREKKCRADVKCVAARAARAREAAEEDTFGTDVAKPLCEATWSLDAAREAIREEKANPSGVVDLVALHQSGQAAQYAQAQIAALTPKYVARRKHAFRGWMTENACLAEYDEQMQQRGCTRVQLDGGAHRWDCP